MKPPHLLLKVQKVVLDYRLAAGFHSLSNTNALFLIHVHADNTNTLFLIHVHADNTNALFLIHVHADTSKQTERRTT